jgi:hypothetical protein
MQRLAAAMGHYRKPLLEQSNRQMQKEPMQKKKRLAGLIKSRKMPPDSRPHNRQPASVRPQYLCHSVPCAGCSHHLLARLQLCSLVDPCTNSD